MQVGLLQRKSGNFSINFHIHENQRILALMEKKGTHHVISLMIMDKGRKSKLYDFFCLISLKIYLNHK